MTGVILSPLDRLRTMLRDCVHVARWMNADSGDTQSIEKRIYIEGVNSPRVGAETLSQEEQQGLRPYIILYASEDSGYRFSRNAAPNCWDARGTLMLVFSQVYEDELSIEEHFRLCAEKIEKIITCDTPNEPGLLEMANSSDYLAIEQLELYFVGRTPQDKVAEYGDAYDVLMMVEYR